MKANVGILAMIITLSIILTSCENASNNNPLDNNYQNGAKEQYIVTLDEDISSFQLGSDSKGTGVYGILSNYKISLDDVTAIYDKVFTGFAANLTQEQVNSLRNDINIKLIEKDQPIFLQGFVESDNNSKKDNILAQTTPWGITAIGGSVDATTNTGVAWIIDTGVDLDHSDLTVNTTLARTFVPTGNDALSADDLHGHGSHVAGIIAAKNNTIGSIGVCAGATVIPVKVFNYQGSSTISRIISGINYVASNLVSGKINVVNLSLGGSASTSLDNAVGSLANAGAYVVIAAGNSAANANNYSPARKNGTRIYTISSYAYSGAFSSFSNYANDPIDYSAPGTSIYSTYKNNGYGTMSGTSMACPHVVGIILARNGSVTYSGTVTNDKDSTPDQKATR